jgi:hypothetical protein
VSETEASSDALDDEGRVAPEIGRHVEVDHAHGRAGDGAKSDHKQSAADTLLAACAPFLIEKLIERAEKGDLAAMRLCLELRSKDRRVVLDIRRIETVQDALAANASIIAAVASGRLTPAEGGHLGNLISNHLKLLEATTLETRVRALEERSKP